MHRRTEERKIALPVIVKEGGVQWSPALPFTAS